MKHNRNQKPGWVMLEMMFATVMIIAIFALLTSGVTSLGQCSHVILGRQQAMLAAEAAMNLLRDGLPEEEVERAPELAGMDLEIERRPGAGDWTGFDRVTVRVSKTVNTNTSVSARLDGYVRVSP